MEHPTVSPPPHFLTKKCILAGTMILFIFLSMHIFLLTHVFTDSEYKKLVDLLTLIVFVSEVVILYGIVHNNVYSVVVVAVGLSILAVISAAEAYHVILPWTFVLIILSLVACSISFAWDLITMKKAENIIKTTEDPANPYRRFNQA